MRRTISVTLERVNVLKSKHFYRQSGTKPTFFERGCLMFSVIAFLKASELDHNVRYGPS